MLNEVKLIGHVGKDHELKQTDNDTSYLGFSLATTKSYIKKDSGEKIKNTDWHWLVAYGKIAEIISKYTGKGSKIYIEGSLHYRTWKDQQGIEKRITEIKVEDCLFLDSKHRNNSSNQDHNVANNDEDDDLPF